ncbi:MAG TPA: type II toxin-antitoxin system PemK/MazF family toxin [Nocardioidaceae bacterium]|nr:type II toxin-antitoxin system PemK/MazF family toxin [Nocardioidaceae bacterium]
MTRSRLGSMLRTVLRGGAAPGPVPAQDSAGRAGNSYAPRADGRPDPGEVVWAWVAYDDDPDRGKDRPVLIIGRDGPTLLGLQLSSKDHDLDAADEARYGRYWMDIGSGAWDHERRPSEVRLDRLLRMREAEVRREGSALDRAVFDAVLTAAREYHDL